MCKRSKKFQTTFIPHDRKTKAKYVWLKYKEILHGKILDVGADEQYLKQYLSNNDQYVGIGLGNCDIRLDLEKTKIPFPINEFDVVLCLDVLEHLDNIHDFFDEICRVSNKYIIVSLPNPWADFFHMLRNRDYKPGMPVKFYGLPIDKPVDRHKWFFSNEEAINFVQTNGEKNNFRITHFDYSGKKSEGRNQLFRLINKTIMKYYFRNIKLNHKSLFMNTLWFALEKNN